ncbi:hypothetical protein GOODEAATRI_022307, partial [Goodea atripinnis]
VKPTYGRNTFMELMLCLALGVSTRCSGILLSWRKFLFCCTIVSKFTVLKEEDSTACNSRIAGTVHLLCSCIISQAKQLLTR